VRVIDGDHNVQAGEDLNRWFNAWRMLDGAAFFVDVPVTIPVP